MFFETFEKISIILKTVVRVAELLVGPEVFTSGDSQFTTHLQLMSQARAFAASLT